MDFLCLVFSFKKMNFSIGFMILGNCESDIFYRVVFIVCNVRIKKNFWVEEE